MKKLIPLLFFVTFFSSCNPDEELFKLANTIKYSIPSGKTTAIATVSNTYKTKINSDTLNVGSGNHEYLWDELDDNGNQVGDGLYLIEISVNGAVVADGSYVVGH